MGDLRAGFPAGVVNVVTHARGEALPIADEFFDRPEVRCINFTGSSATGRMLAERAGRHLKRCVLELGGYNPLIVLADADLDYAVEATAFAACFHSGQICMNARKVLIERPVYDIFIDRLVARAGSLMVGDPAAAGTVIGPLITPAARDRVAREVEEAVAAGAKVLAGGDADGPCYRPTILAGVPAGARIHSEETFGPVLGAQPADNADEAVAIANSTRYGLSAGLSTSDNQRGFALAPAHRRRRRAHQRPDHRRRATTAARRSQGQRVGQVRSGLDGGLHRNPVDHHQGWHRHLPGLAASARSPSDGKRGQVPPRRVASRRGFVRRWKHLASLDRSRPCAPSPLAALR